MIDLSKLSRRCRVRVLRDADADAILALCRENTQYYAYCGRQTSREEILRDLHITPPGKTLADKYEKASFMDADPSRFLRRYSKPRDQELAAFVVSQLSFGQREQFIAKLDAMFDAPTATRKTLTITLDYAKEKVARFAGKMIGSAD